LYRFGPGHRYPDSDKPRKVTMDAAALLREGRLEDALTELQANIRRSPADARLRVLLFQLLALSGQWERAGNQLGVVGELDAKAAAMVQTYRTALACEAFRAAVFAGEKTPLVFGDPEHWLALLLQALTHTAHGRHEEAERQRAEALEQAPATCGELDGQRFDWIADADSRLGPVCEAIVNGKYYWIPFHRLRTIAIEPPEDLRDFVWMPARLTFANSGESVALIPTRYPGSEAQADAALRMSRRTDWTEASGNTYIGLGQRMLATDAAEYALMDVRRIQLDTAAPDAPTDAGKA
jgi:type VI secretion system protein ImpE